MFLRFSFWRYYMLFLFFPKQKIKRFIISADEERNQEFDCLSQPEDHRSKIKAPSFSHFFPAGWAIHLHRITEQLILEMFSEVPLLQQISQDLSLNKWLFFSILGDSQKSWDCTHCLFFSGASGKILALSPILLSSVYKNSWDPSLACSNWGWATTTLSASHNTSNTSISYLF